MQYCTACKLHISSRTQRCPLCQASLPVTQDLEATQTYPVFIPRQKTNKWLTKSVSVTAVMLILSSALTNWATWNGHLWGVAITAFAIYIWLTALITFKRGIHPGVKLMTQAMALTLLLVVIDMFAFGTEIITRASWSVGFAMPFVFIGGIIAINVVMVRNKQTIRDYLLYQLVLCVVGIIPLVLVLFVVAQPLWSSVIAASCSLLTLIGLLICANKTVVSEFARKFRV